MHATLRIPELLNSIFRSNHPPDPYYLLQCALVSKYWSSIALPLLWNYPDDHKDWMSGHESNRLGQIIALGVSFISIAPVHSSILRQKPLQDFSRVLMYSSYLRSLRLSCTSDAEHLANLNLLVAQFQVFPSLRAITFHDHYPSLSDPAASGPLARLLLLQLLSGPTIQRLSFINTRLPEDNSADIEFAALIKKVATDISNLKELFISHEMDSFLVDVALGDYLKVTTQLEWLELSRNDYPPPLVQILASLPTLRSLKSVILWTLMGMGERA